MDNLKYEIEHFLKEMGKMNGEVSTIFLPEDVVKKLGIELDPEKEIK